MKAEIRSLRSSKYELKVISVFQEAAHFSEDIETAKRYFDNTVSGMKKESASAPADLYKCERSGNSLELYHLNIKGDKDRLVGVINGGGVI